MFPEGRILDFLIVGVVALIVVGPKDLPVLMRRVGQFVARMRAMAAEFRASFDEMARQSELDELRAEVDALRNSRPLEAVTGVDQARKVMDDIDTSLRGGAVQLHPPALEPSLPAAASVPVEPAAETPPAAPRRPHKPRSKPAAKAAASRRSRSKSLEPSP